MSSETFNVQICEESLKLSIQANEPHHNNIVQTILRFQEGNHEEIVSISGVSALFSTFQPPEFLKCDEFDCPHYLLIQSYKKELSQGFDYCMASTPNTYIRKSTSESDSQTDSGISGAPLESNFAVHESEAVCSPLVHDKNFTGREEILFNGFPLKTVQQISGEIRKVFRRCNEAEHFKIPIFIVCDGFNSERIVILGVGNNTLIKASCSQVFNGPDKLPTISHLMYNFIFGYYSKGVETTAKARYEVLKRADKETSSVTINCCWQRPSGMLCLPTLDLLSDVELFVCPSNTNNAAHLLQMELSLLESLIMGAEAGEVMWDVKQRRDTVPEQLKTLYEHVNERKMDKYNQSLFELDKLIEQRFSQVRQNLDFTDQVWNVLKESESYTVLKSGFGSIFEAINTDFIRPFVHELDVTKFAKSCKEIMRGEKTVNIKELEPLKLLIEIGLEKIKRDYMSVFLASELVMKDELDEFVSWSSVKEDSMKCVKLLKKLCITLHCIVLLRKYISLPQTVLSNCTTNIFKRLVNTDDIPENFNFSIQNIFLQDKFSSDSLSEWEVKLSCCSESNQLKQMKYQVTKEPHFRGVLDEDSIEKDANSLTKYYGFCLSILSDSLIP